MKSVYSTGESYGQQEHGRPTLADVLCMCLVVFHMLTFAVLCQGLLNIKGSCSAHLLQALTEALSLLAGC